MKQESRMKRKCRSIGVFLVAASLAAMGTFSGEVFGHSGGNVALRDISGNTVASAPVGTPYSPKATCARQCHIADLVGITDLKRAELSSKYPSGAFPGHSYEGSMDMARKQHSMKGAGALDTMGGNPSVKTYDYSVPYPKTGVSASYHVQQGRSTTWGDTQRKSLELFTRYVFPSSNSMYGKA